MVNHLSDPASSPGTVLFSVPEHLHGLVSFLLTAAVLACLAVIVFAGRRKP